MSVALRPATVPAIFQGLCQRQLCGSDTVHGLAGVVRAFHKVRTQKIWQKEGRVRTVLDVNWWCRADDRVAINFYFFFVCLEADLVVNWWCVKSIDRLAINFDFFCLEADLKEFFFDVVNMEGFSLDVYVYLGVLAGTALRFEPIISTVCLKKLSIFHFNLKIPTYI